jgi:hypothetical protein
MDPGASVKGSPIETVVVALLVSVARRFHCYWSHPATNATF